MQPIRLNLATFEYQDKVVTYPALLVAALILLALSAYNIKATLQNEDQISRYESKLINLEQRQRIKSKTDQARRPALSARAAEEVKASGEFINTLIDLDVFPWGRALDVLEACVPPGLILTKLASAKDGEAIRLEGRAGSMAKITQLVEALEQTQVFARNTLVSLNIRPGEPGKGAQEIEFHMESLIDRDRLLSGPGKGGG